MKSIAVVTNEIALPMFDGEFSMMPFDLHTLNGLRDDFKVVAEKLLANIKHAGGTAFLTVHGKTLKKNETLRRGGAHTDGSYDRNVLDWGGGGGWKVGENGPAITSPDHMRLYGSETGGIILASNFESCLGWIGEFDGLPGVGGDCSAISLNEPFMLKRNTVYYGNNHFVHESIPVSEDVHRVFARITMPSDHRFAGA
jgi:hypothetical protein